MLATVEIGETKTHNCQLLKNYRKGAAKPSEKDQTEESDRLS